MQTGKTCIISADLVVRPLQYFQAVVRGHALVPAAQDHLAAARPVVVRVAEAEAVGKLA